MNSDDNIARLIANCEAPPALAPARRCDMLVSLQQVQAECAVKRRSAPRPITPQQAPAPIVSGPYAWGPRVVNFLWLYVIAAGAAAMVLPMILWVPLMLLGFALNLAVSAFGFGKRFGIYALLCLVAPVFCHLVLSRPEPEQLAMTDAELKARRTLLNAEHKERLVREREEAKTRISVDPTLDNYVTHGDRILDLLIVERRKISGQQDQTRIATKNPELASLQEDARRMEPILSQQFEQEFATLEQQMAAFQASTDPGEFAQLRRRHAQMQQAAFYLMEFYGKRLDDLLGTRSMRHIEVAGQLTRLERLSAVAATYFANEYGTLRQTRDTLIATRGASDPEIVDITDRMSLLADFAAKTLRFHDDPRFLDLLPVGVPIWSRQVSTRTSLDIRELNGWPVARGPVILVPSQADQRIRAFNILNAGSIWDADFATSGQDLLPSIHDTSLFIHRSQGVHRLNLQSGKADWQRPAPVVGQSARLGYAGNLILFGQEPRRLSAINAQSRQIVQAVQLSHEVDDICIDSEQTRALVSTGREIIAFELPALREVWRRPIITSAIADRGTIFRGSMYASGDHLVLATADREPLGAKETRLLCLSSDDGRELWRVAGLKSQTPTLRQSVSGLIVGMGKTISLHALDSGSQTWQSTFDSNVFDLRVADDRIVALTGSLHVLSLKDGSELWSLTADDMVRPQAFPSMLHPGDIVRSNRRSAAFPRKGGVEAMRRKILLEQGGNRLFGNLCDPPIVNNRLLFYGKQETLHCIWAGR